MITIQVDTKDATRWLNDVQRKQLPFATAVALTRTAGLVEKSLLGEITAKLDNPSPYTKRSTFKTSAKKTALYAEVGIKDKKPAGGTAPAVLLGEHFSGGLRGNKPMEKAIAALGAMPSGWRVVPGAGMPLDAYGNPKRNAVREVIQSLRSKTQVYKGRGKRVALVGYFVIPVGADSHLQPGIYTRKGRDISPVFLYIKAAGYRKRFDLPALAQRVVAREFNNQFDAALSAALATAR